MKKTFLILFLSVLALNLSAQDKAIKKKSKAEVEYINATMNLEKSKKDFLLQTTKQRMKRGAEEVNGKSLSKEERQVVYKEVFRWYRKELEKEFSKEEIKQISELIKEFNKQKKKKK